MSTSGSRNGSNKSSIRLPLDRMAAVPVSTHSSLNANLLLRDLPPPPLRTPWAGLDNVSISKSPAWRIPRHKCPPCFWDSGQKHRPGRAAGRLARLCKNQYWASTHCLVELLIKREARQAVLTKGENAQGFHKSTAPSRFWLSVRTPLSGLLIALLGQAGCRRQVESRLPRYPLLHAASFYPQGPHSGGPC